MLTADLMTCLREWLIGHVFRTDTAGVKEITVLANERPEGQLRTG